MESILNATAASKEVFRPLNKSTQLVLSISDIVKVRRIPVASTRFIHHEQEFQLWKSFESHLKNGLVQSIIAIPNSQKTLLQLKDGLQNLEK